ncbi:fibronectin type-III domain-containing protein 3a isoform X2 [Tachysurus ichikawai]
MAEHTPPLESGQLLSPDLPLLTPPPSQPPPSMVNGDGSQQVILVQVNPGEAFTIQREDGQFQCITDDESHFDGDPSQHSSECRLSVGLL